jgi:hypothetical protein
MQYQFRQHYTREEARAMLPQIRQWLQKIGPLRHLLVHYDEQVNALVATGVDAGGELVNRSIRSFAQIKDLLREFTRRDIQIKDLERGLIDFPAILGGKEVFLCWEQDEEDIEYWHDLTSGYAGREKL